MRLRYLLVVGCATGFVGCSSVPKHDGYRSSTQKPWQRATNVEFDDLYEAEVEGRISYPDRKRAKWFQVRLPGDGDLDVALSLPFQEDVADPVDLAFEILDSQYNVLAQATAEDDDAGEFKKERTLLELSRGVYYIHVYAQLRTDEAEFAVRLKYNRGTAEYVSDFPNNVPEMTELAIIPVVDDTPAKVVKKPEKKRPEKKRPEKKEETAKLRARILHRTKSGKSTKITIGAGSANGVAKGWKGYLKGPDGDTVRFSIASAGVRQSTATVALSQQKMLQVKSVTLTGP